MSNFFVQIFQRTWPWQDFDENDEKQWITLPTIGIVLNKLTKNQLESVYKWIGGRAFRRVNYVYKFITGRAFQTC